MTLTSDTLLGHQEPRVLFRPEYASEQRGVECIELAESVGLVLDPWQQLCVRVALATREDGLYAANEVASLVARQNGKGGWLEAIILDALFLTQDPLTLWTAHQFKTTSEAFLRIRGWVDGSDDLRRKVRRITAAHGEERIELHTGPRLRFIARSKSSGRGFSPQRVIWDEAQELSKVATDALIPAMRAQRNRQSIYVGTVPGPETNHPDHFTRLRDRGRGRRGSRYAWLEWSPPGSEDPDTAETINRSDPDVIASANPGLGIRITLDTLLEDAESMDPDSYDREALSIWPTIPVDAMGAVDLAAWVKHTNPRGKLRKDAPVTLGVDVAPGRTSGVIAVAGPSRRNGKTLVMVTQRQGVHWLVKELVKLTRKHDVLEVGLDPGGPAGVLLPDLEAAEVDVHLTTTRELGHGTGGLFRALDEGQVEHLGQPELDEAVKASRVKDVLDYQVWDRKESTGDIAPLIAACIALHGYAKHANEDYDPADSIA